MGDPAANATEPRELFPGADGEDRLWLRRRVRTSDYRKDQARKGVLRSAVGLGLGPLLLLGFKLAGLTSFLTTADLLFVCVATALVVGFLLLVVERGAYQDLDWDPHFVYVPAFGALLLFTLLLYLAPEIRVLVLFGWFVVLLFMAGFASFSGAVVLSTLMVLGYSVVIIHLNFRGFFNLLFEFALVVPFFLICIFTAFVLERMRRYRTEMKELRAELRLQARTDPLTELPNRRRFEETLEVELDRCRRYGDSFCVALLDVDHFKTYNDSHGHLAGDAVLRDLGEVIRRQCRTSDLAARFGGEEFALIMVHTDAERGVEMLERIRQVVEGYPFAGQEVQPSGNLTISGGVAAFPDHGEGADDLIQRADEALYRAKDQGRNKVQSAGTGARKRVVPLRAGVLQ